MPHGAGAAGNAGEAAGNAAGDGGGTPAGNAAESAVNAAVSAAKARAEAEKASAEARKAQVEAALVELKARIGEVPPSGYKGEVALKDKAGAMEAALLATRAVREIAATIADAVRSATTAARVREGGTIPREPHVLLFASGEVPTFQALLAFRALVLVVRTALAEAIAASEKADAEAKTAADGSREALGGPELAGLGVAGLGAAGLGLDAVNKLLGYFRTDYQVGGVDVTADDSLLVQAVAGKLASSCVVWLPALFDAAALSRPARQFLGDLEDLARKEVRAKELARRHEAQAARDAKAAEASTDAAQKAELTARAARQQELADRLKAATTLADGLVARLGAADDKGAIPLATALREAAVHEALEAGAHLLVVKLHRAGGGYYVKSGLFAFFARKMPLFHMGGAVAGFALLDGVSGRVLASDVVPEHGGFVEAEELAKLGPSRPLRAAVAAGAGASGSLAAAPRAQQLAPARAIVTIRMSSGNVLCRGEVHRVEGGSTGPVVEGGVEVRPSQPSRELHLEQPGHYQYAFRVQGGSGAFGLEAKDQQGVARGSVQCDGAIQIGLVLNIHV